MKLSYQKIFNYELFTLLCLILSDTLLLINVKEYIRSMDSVHLDEIILLEEIQL